MRKFDNKTDGLITGYDYHLPHIKLLYWACFIFMIIISLICFFPPLWVMLSSMKDVKEFFAVPPTIVPRSFHPEKIIETWSKMNFWKYYTNSFAVIIGSVLVAVSLNGMIAYVFSWIKPRGSKLVFNLILWSMMIPGIMALVPLFNNIVSMGLINTFIPLWLMAGANAFFVLVYKNFFDTIPSSLIEAARIDGCSDLGIFFRIVLPLTKAINMVIIILTVNAAWSDFLLPFLVLKSSSMYTVIVKIYTMSGLGGFSVDQQFIALTFAIIPPTILFLFFQKQIMEGFASSGIKG